MRGGITLNFWTPNGWVKNIAIYVSDATKCQIYVGLLLCNILIIFNLHANGVYEPAKFGNPSCIHLHVHTVYVK